jgi:hypothetical protein
VSNGYSLDKIPLLEKENFRFFVFETETFVEGFNELTNLSITQKEDKEDLKKSVAAAADWMLKMQEEDGNFIWVFNPISGLKKQLHWPRAMLAAWGLAELGKVLQKPEYTEAAEKYFSFAKKYFLDESDFYLMKNPILILSFLGETALSLSKNKEASRCGEIIMRNILFFSFEPISYFYATGFLLRFSKIDIRSRAFAFELVNIITQKFQAEILKNKKIDLAIWAGVATVFSRAYEISREISFLKKAKQVADWLISFQTPDGSFSRFADGSGLSYVRGTGKIAEILAEIFSLQGKEVDALLDRPYYEQSLKKAFAWINSMQYSAGNSFFIPENNIENSIGGFRHDYFNPELWIDSAGHFILAAGRLFKAI